MSIEICDHCDFPYLLIQIGYFPNFNVGLYRAKMRFYHFVQCNIYAIALQRFLRRQH